MILKADAYLFLPDHSEHVLHRFASAHKPARFYQ
jgi:hypothetical protein